MAVNLSRIQRRINEAYRDEDRLLANLQKALAKDTKPARVIKFTTSLNVGGYEKEISTSSVTTNSAGQVLSETVSNHSTHQHNISWEDIDRAYKIQEAIHQMLQWEYEKQGKIYGGRKLYTEYNSTDIKTINGLKTILGKNERFLNGSILYGYKGNYKKNDIAIHNRVLEKIYSEIYKETNRHLLEKFNEISLDGDFTKLIRGSQELIYDIKKVKNWAKEVESIVKSAELKYKAQIKELQRQQVLSEQNKYLLTIEQLEKIGKAILGRAIELCPIETGFLRSSGKLYVSGNDIRIIFEAPYAAYVHDNMSMNHPIGEDHYLEKAAQDILPTISVWTNTTGTESNVLGSYMAQTWEHDERGHAVGGMFWQEKQGYLAVYIDIDRNLNVNYVHYR